MKNSATHPLKRSQQSQRNARIVRTPVEALEELRRVLIEIKKKSPSGYLVSDDDARNQIHNLLINAWPCLIKPDDVNGPQAKEFTTNEYFYSAGELSFSVSTLHKGDIRQVERCSLNLRSRELSKEWFEFVVLPEEMKESVKNSGDTIDMLATMQLAKLLANFIEKREVHPLLRRTKSGVNVEIRKLLTFALSPYGLPWYENHLFPAMDAILAKRGWERDRTGRYWRSPEDICLRRAKRIQNAFRRELKC